MTHHETAVLAALVANALGHSLRYRDHRVRVWSSQGQVRCEMMSGPWAGQWIAILIVGRHEVTGKIVAMALPPVGQDQYHDEFAWQMREAVLGMAEQMGEPL